MQNENEDQILASREYNKLDKKLDKRIKSLSIETLEDIGYASVMEASNRLRRKRVRVHSKPIKFLGYLKLGMEQIYTMKTEDSDHIVLNIKGGAHPIIKYPLNPYERRKTALMFMQMLGYKIHKKGSGFSVYIGKTDRKS